MGCLRTGVLLSLIALSGFSGSAAGGSERAGGDWTRFGYDAARSNSGPADTGITARNAARLVRQTVGVPGTVDSSPIYLRGVKAAGRRRDVFIITTSYGRTVALGADSGRILWRFTPAGYRSWAGTEQITNASPIADPSRAFVYAAAPDGRIHKLAVATGREVTSGSWPVSITRDPKHEKIGTALNFARGLVLAATGGYYGDIPPYQGHVAAIDARSGRLVHVWNAQCSDRKGLIVPTTCRNWGGAIWARAGVVVEPGTGHLLVATGNGKFDGQTNWGDSVVILSPDAGRLLQNWTPRDHKRLQKLDLDLGSTAPVLLGSGLAVQGGKDQKLRLLSLRRLNGRGGARAVTGGELQTLPTPGDGYLFSAPAVLHKDGRTWLFVSTFRGTAGYFLSGRKLVRAWKRLVPGTSPVVAGGLLYVYNPSGGLNIYVPTSGRLVASLAAGGGHWNSPIVTDGRIALGEASANEHKVIGVLNIYRLR